MNDINLVLKLIQKYKIKGTMHHFLCAPCLFVDRLAGFQRTSPLTNDDRPGPAANLYARKYHG